MREIQGRRALRAAAVHAAFTLLLSAAITVVIAGCNITWPSLQLPFLEIFQSAVVGQPNIFGQHTVVGLEKFDSPGALKQYLVDQANQPRRYGFDIPLGMPGPLPTASPTAGPPSEGADDAGSGDTFSTTNIQEAGVDESDQVKNDGEFLYIATAGADGMPILQIVRADPADMRIVSTTALPIGSSVLYLREKQLIVVTRSSYQSSVVFPGAQNTTVVTVLDVADRAVPRKIRTWEFDASLMDSRLIDARLHLILSTYARLTPIGNVMVAEGDISNIIPDVAVTAQDGSIVRRDLAQWTDFYRPIEPDGQSLITVTSLDLDDSNRPARTAVVVADPATVYASREALYLSDSEYRYDGAVRESTDLYKFALTYDGPVLEASGNVPGRILNRYSLGEFEDNLRVATTIGDVFGGSNPARNNVYVLTNEGGTLKIVGKVEDIAPGERIYSARFLGNRGFMVTFKKVDPLFTLDLSNPVDPRVVGELKVPGYSDYIHPLDDDHLVSIGKDAVNMGSFAWYQGVQISVFDVSNFADPQRVDAEIIGDRGTDSEALREPHAFNYFRPAEMLAVPITLYEGAGNQPNSQGTWTASGLFLYHVTPKGVEPAGRIVFQVGNGTYYGGQMAWTRSAFIKEHVFAVTPGAVRVVPLSAIDSAPVVLLLN